MEEKRKDQKAFMLYMPINIYEELKKSCHDQDMTMSKYVIRSIVCRMNLERKERIKY